MSRFIFNLRRVMASRLRAQQQAREHSDQLDAIFALSPDGFISFDALRRVRYVNPAFCQMMDLADLRLEGLDEQDFSAWLTARCVPSSAFAGFDVMRARVLAGEVDAREQIEVNTAPRRVLQLGLRCHEQGAVSQILYFRDITVESQIDAMKSEFMSTAAHELRTPMTSILGFTEVLLTQEMEPATQREFLSIVLDQSKLMASILDELLDLARIEARRGKDFRYTLVAVQKLLSDLVKALPLPPGRSTPVLQLPTEPVFVMADARKLQQAVTNVLTNAYKYSCDCTNQIVHVDVALEAGGSTPERVCIKVTDHGMGMTPEQSRQVFDRFYRADTSGKVLGTGLGMSIVKEIVDLHSGKISIDSTLGQGTCVTLCLPNHAG